MIGKPLLVAGLATTLAMPAIAQSPNGYGSYITIPIVAQTSTYSSAIFIHNHHDVQLSVLPEYVGADGSATVGAVTCTQFSIAPGNTGQYTLTGMCPLNAGSNFGRLKLHEVNGGTRIFAAYSRVQTFSGNGFSIEGFPIGNFSNAEIITSGYSNVTGLRRQAAAPGYQSNCFVGSLNEAVGVTLELFTGANVALGSIQAYFLGANQMIRLLDVFAAVGAPAGDYSNIRAQFSEGFAGEGSFVAFCTVQNNTSFDADFRIAKTIDVGDAAKRHITTTSFTSGVTRDAAGILLPAPSSLQNVQHNWVTFMQHPDDVGCFVTGVVAGGGDVEIQLLDPTGNVAATGPLGFSVFTGEKSTRNGGVNGRWTIQVGSNGAGSDFITAYTLTCNSGNAHSELVYGGTGPDTF